MKMFQFSTHETELLPETRFFTTRMVATATALIAATVSICPSMTQQQLWVTAGLACFLAIPLAAFYGTTSGLSLRRSALLAIVYCVCFIIFVASLALYSYNRIDGDLANEPEDGIPLPPESVSGPIMLISALMACFFGYVTLKLSNVVDQRADWQT